MLKTHELRDIISDYLSGYKSEDWEEFLQVEYEKESNDTININFMEYDESGLINNKYKITIDSVK